MQVLGNNLFFDTVNAISIKVMMNNLIQSHTHNLNHKFIELNKLFTNACIIRINQEGISSRD
jgi:hypothetical protein